ncbi:MAG: carboxypeptidase regulatory-like domain-containing protein, partial [Acidobacteriaceae bacterium]|nr:carboxypeptidase regulatory-like domain-containing protein [Acidobacteriaceae bacterium]
MLGIAVSCVLPGAAQVTANLSGKVTEQSGAAVTAASVTAKDTDTGISRNTLTNPAGQYEFFELPAGHYELRASRDGFAETVRAGIVLVVGQDATADLTLRVGELKQQVTVSENVPVVNWSTQDISGIVGEQQVKQLPLNGRSYDLLLTLNPGIVNFTSQKTGGTGVSNSSTGNNFAVSGNRPQQNLFLLNGVEYTGAAENNMQP